MTAVTPSSRCPLLLGPSSLCQRQEGRLLALATGDGDGMEVGHGDDGGCRPPLSHWKTLAGGIPDYTYTDMHLHHHLRALQLPQASAQHRPIATLVQDTGKSGQSRTKRVEGSCIAGELDKVHLVRTCTDVLILLYAYAYLYFLYIKSMN